MFLDTSSAATPLTDSAHHLALVIQHCIMVIGTARVKQGGSKVRRLLPLCICEVDLVGSSCIWHRLGWGNSPTPLLPSNRHQMDGRNTKTTLPPCDNAPTLCDTVSMALEHLSLTIWEHHPICLSFVTPSIIQHFPPLLRPSPDHHKFQLQQKPTRKSVGPAAWLSVISCSALTASYLVLFPSSSRIPMYRKGVFLINPTLPP